MREYSSREMPEGFLDKGVAAFFGWAGVDVEELGKERILRTSAADAPDIVVVVLVNVASRVPVRSVRHRSAIGPYS
jgi:hypothetical protein